MLSVHSYYKQIGKVMFLMLIPLLDTAFWGEGWWGASPAVKSD